MIRVYGSSLLSWVAIFALVVTPTYAAQGGGVVASAVVVPAQVSRLSFLTSALVKEVSVKEGDHVTAGQTLAVLNMPELEFNTVAAQQAFRAAQAEAEIQRYNRVRHVRNGKKYWDLVPPEVRQKADAQAASAQARLDISQALLAQSTLTAPYEATVADVAVAPGEYVNPNQVVITLAALNTLQLETTDLSERDINKVKLGAPVNIWMESMDQTFDGTVIAISPIADTIGGDVVFKVTIAFEEPPEGLLWGMTAEVTIEEK